ncbi:transposase family protein [Nostoc flagelliforme]|uniref:transposase family protein n=1 Tax=Nostoc flagelliforme TaxID=1306274 RepID=UPI00298E6421|nr:transposase family protein [Nostoc flagelliforme]
MPKQILFDEQQTFEGDKGYQGGKNITTPHKRKRKQELSEQQKTENKILSSKRIFVEHLIRIIKIWEQRDFVKSGKKEAIAKNSI